MKKIIIFTLLATLLFAVGCEKEKAKCGCESETIREIHQYEGEIFYKDSDIDDYYNQHFWITIGEGGFFTHFIICNESFLNDEFDDLKSTDEPIDIKFSGYEKEVCNRPVNIANISYKKIELTSIEKL